MLLSFLADTNIKKSRTFRSDLWVDAFFDMLFIDENAKNYQTPFDAIRSLFTDTDRLDLTIAE